MNLNLSQITSKLSTRGWITVGAATLIGVLFVYVLMSIASKPSYSTLVAGVSPSQTGKITSALSTAGVPYQLQNNGTAVAVETAKESQARIALDEQGLLNGTGSGSSFESLLGKTSLGESNFQQEQQNTSALEQQIEQTLEDMNGVNSAQVELAIPDQTDNLFSGVNTQPSASVVLNEDGSLGSSSVKAIAASVSHAVPGLSAKKVTITDQDGTLLWPGVGGSTDSLTAAQSAQEAYDTQESARADAYLETTLGTGKAIVQINATLNTNRQKIDEVTYGKDGTPLSANKTNEKLTGNGSAAAGAAGNTATNIAAYAGKNGTGTSNYSNKTDNSTFGVDKKISSSTITPGALKHQTVSVLVNKSVPAASIPAIRSAVENAVGFVPGRDKISVGNIAFAKPVPVAAASSSSKLGDVKYVAVGAAALIFLLLMSRLLRRRENEAFAGRPTWLRELETPRPLAALEAERQMLDLEGPTGVSRLRSPMSLARQQVEELVDRDPERVASQVRQWMTED